MEMPGSNRAGGNADNDEWKVGFAKKKNIRPLVCRRG
jgi:hypothetical protein